MAAKQLPSRVSLPASRAVTMDVDGHLFSSDAEDLAAKLDAMWRDSQTNKRRTRTALKAVDGKPGPPETQYQQGLFEVPSAGSEPATPGLGSGCEGSEEEGESPETQ